MCVCATGFIAVRRMHFMKSSFTFDRPHSTYKRECGQFVNTVISQMESLNGIDKNKKERNCKHKHIGEGERAYQVAITAKHVMLPYSPRKCTHIHAYRSEIEWNNVITSKIARASERERASLCAYMYTNTTRPADCPFVHFSFLRWLQFPNNAHMFSVLSVQRIYPASNRIQVSVFLLTHTMVCRRGTRFNRNEIKRRKTCCVILVRSLLNISLPFKPIQLQQQQQQQQLRLDCLFLLFFCHH